MLLRHVAASSGDRDRRAERGETLIEVLVMIVLMGIGFTAIFSGLMTVSRINHANARRTKASIAVQAWTEGLQQPAQKLTGSNADIYRYYPCGTPGTYGSLFRPDGLMPSSWVPANQSLTRIEYFTGTFDANGEPQFDDNPDACWARNVGGKVGDQGMQRITVKVETPAGQVPRAVDTLVFIKRNQSCPDVAGFDNADLGPC